MDTIIRAYTRLLALRKNIPQEQSVKENFVQDYHQIVDLLAKETASDLEEFKIPANEVRHKVTSTTVCSPFSDEKLHKERSCSEDRYCEAALFFSKLDALLSYFQITHLSHEKQDIGFKFGEAEG